MQIRAATQSDVHRRTAKTNTTGIKSKPNHSHFHALMDEVLPPNESNNLDLNQLWKDLPEIEHALLQKPNQENLEEYRKIIISIAKRTLEKNTSIQTMRKRNSKKQEVILTFVRFIDDRIQQMVHTIQSHSNSAFAMLKNFEEIRGMLLDIRE